jgi:argonaute-like protein implicated in RNA metabolism and viral defense
MAVSAADKKKLLKEGAAIHAAAYAAISGVANTLSLFLQSNARIDKEREKAKKFIAANRGKKAKVQAELKRYTAFVAKEQSQYDAAKKKALTAADASAKKVSAFVKKHKAALKSGPQWLKLAKKLEWATATFKKMQMIKRK